MLKSKVSGKLALNSETLRTLTNQDLRNVQGGGSIYTKMPSCSTDGYVCEDSVENSCKDGCFSDAGGCY